MRGKESEGAVGRGRGREWFKERKDLNDIHGVYVMLMYRCIARVSNLKVMAKISH